MIQDAWIEGRQHIEKLCDDNSLRLVYKQHDYRTVYDGLSAPLCSFISLTREIQVQSINNEFNYLAALHEIGHAVRKECCDIFNNYGPYGAYLSWDKTDILDNEAYAWEWACNNSIYGMSIDVMALVRCCFRGYHEYITRWYTLAKSPKSSFLYAILNY